MIIAIDFDGTLNTAQYPALGAPTPYSKQVMQKLAADGHYLIIWTSREGNELIEAINWLLENEIPFHRINDNHPHNTAQYSNNCRKIFADIYIDDKQVGGLPDWNSIYEYIND